MSNPNDFETHVAAAREAQQANKQRRREEYEDARAQALAARTLTIQRGTAAAAELRRLGVDTNVGLYKEPRPSELRRWLGWLAGEKVGLSEATPVAKGWVVAEGWRELRDGLGDRYGVMQGLLLTPDGTLLQYREAAVANLVRVHYRQGEPRNQVVVRDWQPLQPDPGADEVVLWGRRDWDLFDAERWPSSVDDTTAFYWNQAANERQLQDRIATRVAELTPLPPADNA